MPRWVQGSIHASEPRPLSDGLVSMVLTATPLGNGNGDPALGWRGLRFGDARASSDDDVLDVGHVAPGGSGGVMRRRHLLVRVVMLGGFVQQVRQRGDVHVSRPIPARGSGS